MLWPFRRKAETAPDFEQRLSDFRKQQELQKEEMEELCLLAGRTLFKCALVEGLIHDVLNHIVGANADFGKWLQTGKPRPKLARAINELRRRFGLSQDFLGDLDRFRTARNSFVHDIWRVGKAHLETPEGRLRTAAFILDLYAQADALNNVFWPVLRDHYKQLQGRDIAPSGAR